MKNESPRAYQRPYLTSEFTKNFVAKKNGPSIAAFNYNNVDYILLTRVLEAVSKQTYPELLRANIFNLVGIIKSGVFLEDQVILGGEARAAALFLLVARWAGAAGLRGA